MNFFSDIVPLHWSIYQFLDQDYTLSYYSFTFWCLASYSKFIFPCELENQIFKFWDFPGGAVVKNPPANAGDTGSSPGLGGSHMLQSN